MKSKKINEAWLTARLRARIQHQASKIENQERGIDHLLVALACTNRLNNILWNELVPKHLTGKFRTILNDVADLQDQYVQADMVELNKQLKAAGRKKRTMQSRAVEA